MLVAEVLYGRLAAMEPSMLDLLCRLARPHDGVLGYVPTLPDAQALAVNQIRMMSYWLWWRSGSQVQG